MTNDLLTLVDELTQPIRVEFWQGLEKHTRTDDPLLLQLKAAVVSNMGGGSGASKSARERTPLDVQAFSLLEEIDGRVRSWHIDYASRAPYELTNALRGWYVLFTRHPKEEADISRHMSILAGWVGRISDIVDPPKRIELTVPCPRCNRRWITRGVGHEAESTGALSALLRNGEEFEASCGGCGHRWVGIGAVRMLRTEIDEKEAQKSHLTSE